MQTWPCNRCETAAAALKVFFFPYHSCQIGGRSRVGRRSSRNLESSSKLEFPLADWVGIPCRNELGEDFILLSSYNVFIYVYMVVVPH
jgi:hypothetical protein